MDPYYVPISGIFRGMFSDLMNTNVTATITFGVRMCFEETAGLCFGGGFGFAVNGMGNGFIFRESIQNVVEHIGDASESITSTFYIEGSIYDNIDDIHGTELSREVNSNIWDNAWFIDPAVVYDAAGNAVGVTFCGEVDISGQLSVGVPIGSIIVDKVAELETGNAAKKESLFAALTGAPMRGHSLGDYYPMMFICGAVGIGAAFAGKLLWSKARDGAKYQPL